MTRARTTGRRAKRRTTPKREFVVLGHQDWYKHPGWYDALHTPGTGGEVGGVLRIARRYGKGHAKGSLTVLEPACGTGRYLRVLASRGHRVVGIDSTPEMVVYARERLAKHGSRARVMLGDMASFQLPGAWRCDLAFNLINSIRHLPSDAAMLSHLRSVRAALTVGGIYVVGMSVCQYGAEFPSEDVWRAVRGSLSVTQVVQYHPAPPRSRKEAVHSLLIAVTPTREAHLNSAYHLRAYSCPQWTSLIRRSGFTLAEVTDEVGDPVRGGVASGVWTRPTTSGYALWVMRKDR